jgi:PAS domain S-box-containing protein
MTDSERRDTLLPAPSSAPRRVTATGLAELLDLSPDALLIVNQAETIMMANEQVSALFGYSSEELLGKPPELLLPESLRVFHGAQRQQYFTTPRTRSMGTGLQLLGRRKDGTQFPVDFSLRPVLLQDELLVIAAIRDMSEQAAARAEAEAAHARLYELFMQAPVAMAILRGPEHRYEFANALSFSYRHRPDPTGKTVREALPELVEQGHLTMLDIVYTTGTPFIGSELPLRLDRRGDGVLEEGYYNLVFQPTRNLQGDIDGIWVYSMDVTEHVRARRLVEELNQQLEAEKQALRQAQREAETQAAELSAIFEAMTEGVFVCDGRGTSPIPMLLIVLCWSWKKTLILPCSSSTTASRGWLSMICRENPCPKSSFRSCGCCGANACQAHTPWTSWAIPTREQTSSSMSVAHPFVMTQARSLVG